MTNFSTPTRVGVLMVAYKAEKTIRQAVESILADPVPHHLYIVDDASPVPVKDILGPLPENVTLVRLAKNSGQGVARNTGIRRILENSHEFMAVMDADDVSRPDRFTKQVSFLDANPDIAVVGSWAMAIDESGSPLGPLTNPTTPEDIRKHLFYDSCFQHPTLMMRTRVLREIGMYDETFPVTQDYELMYRISRQHDVANLPEFLLDYRISSTNISSTKAHLQRRACLRIQLRHFQPLHWRWWAGTSRTLLRVCVPRKVIRQGRRVQRKIGRIVSPQKRQGQGARP